MLEKLFKFRRYNKTFMKKLSSMLLVILIVSAIIPSTRSIDDVEEKVKIYLLEGERVTEKRKLSFGNIELTIYYLSSGHYIVYSHNHDKVVLGDEWLLEPYADDQALQLISLLVYDKVSPLKDDFDNLLKYRLLSFYWNLSYVKGLQIAEGEKWKIFFINVGATIVLIVLVPPVGVVGWLLLAASFTTNLLSDINRLQAKFKLTPEMCPRLFRALALLPAHNDEALQEFKKLIDSITDPKFKEHIEKIRRGVDALDKSLDIAGYVFMIAYAHAVASQEFVSHVRSPLGEAVVKTGAYLIFRNSPDPIGKFNTFSDLSSGLWSGSTSAYDLSALISDYAMRTLKNIAISSIINTAKDYVISLGDDLRTFLGFHTMLSLIARDLSNIIYHKTIKLINGEEAPTLNSLATYSLLKYLLFTTLLEYSEGVLELSDQTIGKMYGEILSLWGSNDIDSIRKKFKELKNEYSRLINLTNEKFIEYSCTVYVEFDKYRAEMARRRGRKPVESGVQVFLVIDTSGSMADEFRGQRKIDAAKAAAKDFVSLISRDDRVGIVKFSTSAELVSDLTNDKSSLVRAIDKLMPGGRTAIGDGIWLALDQLETATGLRAVILLTDGIHNAGVRTPEEAARRARSLGIPIYTLGFGEKQDIDEATMRTVAEMTGGQYFYSPGPDDLRKLYIILSQRISGYLAERVMIDKVRAGEVKTITTTVPRGTPYLGIRLSYSGSKLSLELVSPSGYTLSLRESNVVYIEESDYVFVSVYNPEVGDWRIHVRGVATPPEGLEYRMVVLKPSVSTNVDMLDLKMKVGESREITVKLKATMDLALLELAVVGSVIDLVESIEPRRVTNVKEGQEIPVRIRFTVPASPSAWSYSGGIQITAAASKIYLPITVTLDALFAAAFINATELKPGRAAQVIVTAVDVAGRAVTGARVTTTLGGKTYTFEDRGDGSYSAVLTGLREGIHTLTISVVKEGYLPVIYSFQITVRLPGDINRDWVVDYRDIAILVAIYGSGIGDPFYNLDADINEDGVIDYRDLALLIGNYGAKV